MQFNDVTCPHCGLLCDDLTVEVNDLSVQLKNNNHPLCKQAFEDASFNSGQIPSPLVNGSPATLQQALDAAAQLLKNSKQPLISGMIGDIQTCRDAVALTEKVGGVVDHANGSGIRINTSVMQRMGEVRTTLAEVRNRADCVVIFGAGVLENFPRLYERILTPAQSLGNDATKNKKIFLLDRLDKNEIPSIKNKGAITYFQLEAPSLDSIAHKLLEVINKPIEIFDEIDDTLQILIDLHQTILNSQYTTFIWAAGEFKSDIAEHTVQTMTQMIKQLMEKVRCVGLPLGGSRAEVTANQVATWQTGVSLPVAFMSGVPIHNPILFDGMKMLQNKEADTLVWITTYNSNDNPPETDIPTIVIGHPKMKCANHVDVFIPTGIPGIDHRGLACRTDNVATLPLKSIRTSQLASANDVISQLSQLL